MNETSQPIELLLSVDRDAPATLGAQIEDRFRRAIRDGALRPGARVPSTRDLARQLGVSRRVAVDAYAQLAAEGWLQLRQGARPHVSDSVAVPDAPAAAQPAGAHARPRFDFRPAVPDVSTFPRAAWLRSVREALSAMTDAELAYGDPRGVEALRAALSEYLGRVRGVVPDPARIMITCGYFQGLGLLCRALAATGARRLALEDPSNPEQAQIARSAGLEPVGVAVDEEGLRVDDLERTDADAVVVTPAHQDPTGVVLSGERRTALIAWLRDRDAVAIEDDYDAEYRYDRAAVGALQGLDPEHVVYCGSASKTLVPALRLGWMLLPPALDAAVAAEKLLADRGTNRIDQHAFTDFLARGELDRHLRRMRVRYRARRDALVDALAEALPDATVEGVAAGLHVTVRLPDGLEEEPVRAAAHRRRIALATMGDNRVGAGDVRPALLLGYAQLPEPAIRAGVRELAEAVRSVRAAA
jgi:GntR family transcriptional regulator/MocR family aminotransferase